MTKTDPDQYEAAWESVLECVDGMKEEFNWSKDIICKMLREMAVPLLEPTRPHELNEVARLHELLKAFISSPL